MTPTPEERAAAVCETIGEREWINADWPGHLVAAEIAAAIVAAVDAERETLLAEIDRLRAEVRDMREMYLPPLMGRPRRKPAVEAPPP